MVTFTINIPSMLAYIPAPWIRHGVWIQFVHRKKDEKKSETIGILPSTQGLFRCPVVGSEKKQVWAEINWNPAQLPNGCCWPAHWSAHYGSQCSAAAVSRPSLQIKPRPVRSCKAVPPPVLLVGLKKHTNTTSCHYPKPSEIQHIELY